MLISLYSCDTFKGRTSIKYECEPDSAAAAAAAAKKSINILTYQLANLFPLSLQPLSRIFFLTKIPPNHLRFCFSRRTAQHKSIG